MDEFWHVHRLELFWGWPVFVQIAVPENVTHKSSDIFFRIGISSHLLFVISPISIAVPVAGGELRHRWGWTCNELTGQQLKVIDHWTPYTATQTVLFGLWMNG